MSEQADLDRMRKAANAIYIAVDKVVADDISAMLKTAANEIEKLRADLKAAHASLQPKLGWQ